MCSLVESYWHDWLRSCENKGVDSNQQLAYTHLEKLWTCSDFAAQNCIRYPAVLYRLHEEGFEVPRLIDDYRKRIEQVVTTAGDDDELMKALRELRQQEMLRIAWRDINALASVKIILEELSDFSEAIVSIVSKHLEQQHAEKHGVPCDENGDEQPLLVFAMGKMGGRELNFSSDIDLIFAFSEDAETTGRRKISHHEFYKA